MPRQEEAMVVEDMANMTQFVYDMYNSQLESLVTANKQVRSISQPRIRLPLSGQFHLSLLFYKPITYHFTDI